MCLQSPGVPGRQHKLQKNSGGCTLPQVLLRRGLTFWESFCLKCFLCDSGILDHISQPDPEIRPDPRRDLILKGIHLHRFFFACPAVYQYDPLIRIYDSVLPDAGRAIFEKFDRKIHPLRRRGYHLNDPVRSSDAAFFLRFGRITDHCQIRLHKDRIIPAFPCWIHRIPFISFVVLLSLSA